MYENWGSAGNNNLMPLCIAVDSAEFPLLFCDLFLLIDKIY